MKKYRSLIYPGVLSSSLVSAAYMYEAGVPASVVVMVSFVITLLLTTFLEHLWPWELKWNGSAKEYKTDVFYLGLAAFLHNLTTLILGPLVTVFLLMLKSADISILDHATKWPLIIQILVGLVLADLGKYWMHRWAHEKPWLWKFHATHHAPEKMYAFNGVRVHPINLLWGLFFDVSVPLLLGLNSEAILFMGVTRGAVSILQHANIRMNLSFWNWIFSTPDLHQWHHSIEKTEGNSNYGSTFILWDILFKTRFYKPGRPETLGLWGGVKYPQKIYQQLLEPCWRKSS